MKHALLSLTVGALCVLAATSARAHDTWFEPLPAPGRGELAFALGTGNRFPVFELAVDTQHFVASGCRSTAGDVRAFAAHRYTDHHTALRLPADDASSLSCWVQLAPFDIELPLDKVPVYFAEIRPRAEVVAAWERLRARGLPFRERYVKSARIDGDLAPDTPHPTATDVLRVAPAGRALRVGDEVTFRVLRDGQALPDQPLELVNERSPVGLWVRTDAQGQLRARLPLPGRWLLRGTDLRLAPDDPERFASQFISYSFRVQP